MNTKCLYFAYGSNMDVLQMQQRCPTASLAGRATLKAYRFIIQRDGFASVVADPMAAVFGLLWQLQPEDEAALDQYEGISVGLYRKEMVTVRNATGQNVSAMIYIAEEATPGQPEADYLKSILAAARAFSFPETYCQQLEQWG